MMKGLCEAVQDVIGSGEYESICVVCDDFSQAVEATRELIDLGIGHGSSGASKAVYEGRTWEGEELLYLYIKHCNYNPCLEYYYMKPLINEDQCVIYCRVYLDDEDFQVPDIGSFLGI